MSKCGWCGNMITGEPILTIEESAMVMYDGDSEVELMPGYVVDFCCHGCAWAFSAEIHRMMGLSGKNLRNHLIDVHGFNHPPDKPGGGMTHDCMVVDIANNLASMFGRNE